METPHTGYIKGTCSEKDVLLNYAFEEGADRDGIKTVLIKYRNYSLGLYPKGSEGMFARWHHQVQNNVILKVDNEPYSLNSVSFDFIFVTKNMTRQDCTFCITTDGKNHRNMDTDFYCSNHGFCISAHYEWEPPVKIFFFHEEKDNIFTFNSRKFQVYADKYDRIEVRELKE